MAPEKFVFRLLDDDGLLLAWATVYAEPRPQERGASCPFWPLTDTKLAVEADGLATRFSVHWCELDVARVEQLMEPAQVSVGQVFVFAWIQPVWLVPGTRDVPLPGVTIRESVTLAPSTGSLTGAGQSFGSNS